VGPVGDEIGSPPSSVDQGEPHPRLTRAHAAQGGITLGPGQGEPGANFCHLGIGLGGAALALGATQGCLLYLVALLHLPSLFRFVVLV
jgi:hypothetical protein